MKIDITSLCFGFKIEKENDSGTPAWATSIGQAPKGICYVDTEREGLDELVYGMMYKSHSDFENLKVHNVIGLEKKEEPRSDRERMMFSVFEDVYVNGKKVNGIYTLSYEREDSDSHKNRLHICYAKYLTYKEHSNKKTLQEMAKVLECDDNACWFVTDINVVNQSQLHFSAIVVNPNNSMTYANSRIRKQAWDNMMGKVGYEFPISCEIASEHPPYLTAIKSKPFLLLAGISGTGKSRIVREFAFKSCPKWLQDKEGTTPGNYCMIEVKPNWHDSTELLGYYSRLGKAGYQFTKFVKFLVKAKMFPKVPFFVCLDEMNLAPVEQYFAEILSILETRKHPKNTETGKVDMNTVKTEPIIDARYFRELSEIPIAKNAQTGETFKSNLTDRDIYLKLFGFETEKDIDEEVGKRYDLTTEGLTLPDNVIIIGTVNMDDTTHQFSRKVIDRAMTIEMNGGNLRSMFGGSKDLEYLPEEEQKKWQNAFTRRYVTADEVLEAHSDVADKLMEELPARLETINNALKGTPFEVSYRVLNEFTIMVGVMLDENRDIELDDVINQALNSILLMKILPRIEGDAEMFALSRDYNEKMGIAYHNRLEWLKELAPDIHNVSTEDTSKDGNVPEKNKEHQQTTKEKIQEMIDRLNNQEYTRFWP